MATINGTIECRLLNRGTKSEGCCAILICDDGKEYTLYRNGLMPVNDSFFTPLDKQRVTADGNIEENSGYFMVTSIVPENDCPKPLTTNPDNYNTRNHE